MDAEVRERGGGEPFAVLIIRILDITTSYILDPDGLL